MKKLQKQEFWQTVCDEKANQLVMKVAQMLEHSGSLTGQVRSHLSRDNCSTDTILVKHRRATHEPFTQPMCYSMKVTRGQPKFSFGAKTDPNCSFGSVFVTVATPTAFIVSPVTMPDETC